MPLPVFLVLKNGMDIFSSNSSGIPAPLSAISIAILLAGVL